MDKRRLPKASDAYYPSRISEKTTEQSIFYETVNKNMRKIENRLTVPPRKPPKNSADKNQTHLIRKPEGHAFPIQSISCQENYNGISPSPCYTNAQTNVSCYTNAQSDKYMQRGGHKLASYHGVQSSEKYCFVTGADGSRKLKRLLILSNYSNLPKWKHEEILKASSRDLWKALVDNKQDDNPIEKIHTPTRMNNQCVNHKMFKFSQDPVIQKVVIKQPGHVSKPITTLAPAAGTPKSSNSWSKIKSHHPSYKKKVPERKITDQRSVTTSTMSNLLCMNCFDPGNGEDDLSTIESDSGSDGGEGSDDGGAGDNDDLDDIDAISDIEDIEFSSGGGDDDDGSDVSDGSSMHQDDLIHDEEMNIAMNGEFGDQEEIGETDYANQMLFDEMNSIDEDERRGRYYYDDREDPFFDPIDNELKYNDIFLPSSGNSGEDY